MVFAAAALFVSALAGPRAVYAASLKTITPMSDGYDEIVDVNLPYHAIRVVKDGKYGVINENGELTAPLDFAYIGEFAEGVAAATADGVLWGYIDNTGDFAIPADYDDARPFSDGLAVVEKDGLYGAIDINGDERIKFEFEEIGDAGQGLYPAESGGKWGYINRAGDTALPFLYDGAEVFSEGFAAVEENGLWGIINKAGAAVSDFEFSYAGEFINGLAEVEKDGQTGVVNKYGDVAIPYETGAAETAAQADSENIRVFYVNDMAGIADADDNIIAPAIFEGAAVFDDKYLALSKEGEYGLYEIVDAGGDLSFEKPKNQDLTIAMDGAYIAFDQPPLIVNGRAFAPAKQLCGSIGAELVYDENFTYIKITRGDTEIAFYIGSREAYVNGVPYKLDENVEIINGRTYVPVKFLTENLGITPEWDGDTKTVTLVMPYN